MDELPPEVQLHVIRFLSFRDKLCLRQTSSGLLSLVDASSVTLRWRVNIAALRGIAAALQRKDSLFCCGGTTRACRPLTLFFKGTGSSCGFVTFPTDPSSNTGMSRSLQGLLDCCSSASAPTTQRKKKGQTLLQLSPSDFSINFRLEEHDSILEKVKLMMSPNSHKVRAELYQLSIIFPSSNKEEDEEEEEEEQKKEEDEQEGNLHPHLGHGRENETDLLFGLLEVCLPKTFQGGKLEVRHSQQPWKAVFDLSSRVGDQDHQEKEKEEEEEEEEVTSSEIKWAAYHLSGCLSRVLPVTQGYRISLVYKLYRHPLLFPPQSEKLYRHPLHLPPQSETQQEQEQEQPVSPKKKKRRIEDSPQQRTTTVSLDLFSLLQQKLEAIAVDACCLADEGVTLAFHCQYSYSCEAVAQTPSLNSLLKGFDALLHETATHSRAALRTSLGCFQPLCMESFAESDFPTLFFGFETFPQRVDVVRKMPKGNWDDCQRYVADNYDVCELRDVLLPLDDGDGEEEEEKKTNESERKQRERLMLEDVRRSFGEKLTAAEARNLAWDSVVMEETEEECLGDLPTKAVQWCNLNRGRLPYEQHHFAGRILFAVGAVPGSGRRPTTSPRTAAFTAEPVLYIQVPPNK
ncbi:hypothetical protein QOT17_009510 [Balamuthia mandrillaris]